MERKNAMFFKLKNDWTTRTIVEAVVNLVLFLALRRELKDENVIH